MAEKKTDNNFKDDFLGKIKKISSAITGIINDAGYWTDPFDPQDPIDRNVLESNGYEVSSTVDIMGENAAGFLNKVFEEVPYFKGEHTAQRRKRVFEMYYLLGFAEKEIPKELEKGGITASYATVRQDLSAGMAAIRTYYFDNNKK